MQLAKLPARLYIFYIYNLFFSGVLEKGILKLFCVWVFAHVCVCVPYAYNALWRPEESLRSPGTGTTDDYELPCGHGELNPGPLGRAASLFNL